MRPRLRERFCPRCGSLHDPNTGSCPEFPLAAMPDGLRVLERLSETSLGVLYRAEYLDSHDEVELVILHPGGTGSEPIAEAPGLFHCGISFTVLPGSSTRTSRASAP